MAETVLVTGGSGFVGVHCILQLLEAGYEVRTTVRSLGREADVRSMLQRAGADPGERLRFVAADLTADGGWEEAVAGCDYVLHVASPFPQTSPKDENELILPAREGTLRVLRAAQAAGVKRVVLTSSFAAVGYGYPATEGRIFAEDSWSNIDAGLEPYVKSKTVAERAAWDFVEAAGAPELAVVNPVGIVGPALGRDLSTSVELVKMILEGAMPRLPRIWFGLVDVRDVADLHLRAMVNAAAAGERFVATAGERSARDVALVIKQQLPQIATKVPTKELPDWLVRVAALVNSSARQAVPNLGAPRRSSSEKARRLLGWEPRSPEDGVLATVESLVTLGLVSGAAAVA